MLPRYPTRRSFLKNASTAAAALGCHNAFAGLHQSSQTRPNIVFFLGEGVRWDESSLAGNKILHTPHIDRIGAGGVTFNNAFVTNALCAPGRASALTGAYGHSSGVVSNQHNTIPPSFPIVTDVLRDAGYEVAFVGKSHVANALTDRYWDYYFGFKGQADYQNPVITEGRHGHYEQTRYRMRYVDDLLTERAVSWLREPHEKPVCLLLWFYAPHAPFIRPPSKVNDYNGIPVPVPKSFTEQDEGYKGKPKEIAEALNKVGFQFNGHDNPRSLEELVKDHYAGVESNDDNIGKIMQILHEKNMADNTAMLWSSDHGFFLGEHRFYDKRLMYEPSIRVPMMIRYPKRIPTGTVRNEMVLNIDIAPTLLDIANAPIPSTMQGRSVMPLAERKQVSDWRKEWLYEYYEYPGYENIPPNRGIRTTRYKYIEYFTLNQFELYDLKTDPDEMNNLYGQPSHAHLVEELKTRLQKLREETNDHYVYQPTTLRNPNE